MPDKELLQGFADNETLSLAIKELLLSKFSYHTIGVNQNNQATGEAFRVIALARQKVEDAFRELAQHKTVPDPVDKVNPAR